MATTSMSCWHPNNHRYDGTCEATRLVLPHYATMPDRIRVYDGAVRRAGWTWRQRKLWRKARNVGLARWGYPVEVIELWHGGYRPEGITLGTTDPVSAGFGANSYGGFGLSPIELPWFSEYDPETWDLGKGFALINVAEVRNAFASNVTGRLAGVICHEVGHALGFGHGGLGIMESSVNPPYYPTVDELAALELYWGRA